MDESRHSPMEESPLLEDSPLPTLAPAARRVAPFAAAAVVAIAGLGYALHERHAAQNVSTQNAQMTAQLNATHSQLNALAAKVNTLVAAENKPSPATPAAEPAAAPAHHRARVVRVHRPSAQELRLNKMQAQLDAQGQEINDERTDLTSAKTELGGSIARTHDELVLLEKKGERSYFEFDIYKSKQFRREGPLEVSLRKANEKHQYADLQLIVDDRTLTQKHVNLDQPVMFYQNENGRPVEIVINSITKNHIHGYISAPKYRQEDLAAASGAQPSTDQAAASTNNGQPQLHQRVPMPEEDQQ